MGNLNNCCICKNFDLKDGEDKFQTNFFNFFRKQTYNDDFKNFIIVKNSKYELENNLKKIRQKFAIKKIIRQFKKYKLKNELISPILNKNKETFIIDSNYSKFFLSSIKKKKISNFITNNMPIDNLFLNIKNKERSINNEIEFETSTSTLTKRHDFNKNLQKIIDNNRNYIVFDPKYFIKQKGMVKFSLGKNNFYIGEFFKNDFSGYGLFINNKIIIYEGYWINNIQSGYGIETWDNHSEYKGEFLNGCKNGIGTYIWEDDSRYEGEWKNNCFDGYGIYYYSKKKVYLGEWKMNQKCGYGVYLTNDIIYVGNYMDDKKNGFGIFYWRKKNEAYVGFFKEGKQYGFGKYIFKRKKAKYGIWNPENKKENKVKWFHNNNDANTFIIKNDLVNYKYFFLLNINEISNFCNILNNDETLDLYIY